VTDEDAMESGCGKETVDIRRSPDADNRCGDVDIGFIANCDEARSLPTASHCDRRTSRIARGVDCVASGIWKVKLGVIENYDVCPGVEK